MLRLLGALALLLSLSCRTVGSPQIYTDRIDYNEAIVRTTNEQLLLNLVRLRYRDTPFFLQVGSVSTQFEWSGTLGLGADYDSAGAFGGADAALGMKVASKPTVTYSPLQGESFVRHMLSPIQLEHLLLLYHSGWSIERVLKCCVQGLNDVANAPSASGPTPLRPPVFEDFAALADALRDLQRDRQLEFGIAEGVVGLTLRLAFHPSAPAERVQAVRAALGLDDGLKSVELLPGSASNGGGTRVAVDARSLLGVLFFLSQAVEVPIEHVREGLVTVTRDEAGEAFDWQRVAGDLIHVRSTRDRRPQRAAVAVRYRGTWFYIADDDLTSKSTFSLLGQLFALQGGDARIQAPTLTLPIGG